MNGRLRNVNASDEETLEIKIFNRMLISCEFKSKVFVDKIASIELKTEYISKTINITKPRLDTL